MARYKVNQHFWNANTKKFIVTIIKKTLSLEMSPIVLDWQQR